MSILTFSGVTFSYDSSDEPLIVGLTAAFPEGWTGVVGANGTGKSTLLRLAVGDLTPQSGTISTLSGAVYCRQRTDDPPEGLAAFLESGDLDADAIKSSLGVGEDWPVRWKSLSHGERKRAQVAVELWVRPAVLALDEPTNHIDSAARSMLERALDTYRGVGLLVSHDRALLDALCHQCLFLDPPEYVMRPGGYSRGAVQSERDAESRRKAKERLSREAAKLRRETARRAQKAAQADSRRSKRHLDRKDHDGRERIDRALVTGKDASAGRLLRQMQSRLERAQSAERSMSVKKEYETGIWMQGQAARRDYLFRLPAGRISLGDARSLEFPELFMRPSDRVSITGPNGAGKSTLVRRIIETAGIPNSKLIYVPQEIDLEQSRSIMDEAKSLSGERLGMVLAAVSRLGSRPQRLLETAEPSPGETRKLLLALGLSVFPHLIVMDEPTNHMDLPSVECLEQALADCPCGLLLVSHDKVFLEKLATVGWEIRQDRSGNGVVSVG